MHKLLLPAAILLWLSSCSAPMSKESYIEKFSAFIKNIDTTSQTYDEDDWIKANKRYEKFTGDWYDKFSDEMTTFEKLKVKAWQVQYNFIRAQQKSLDYYNKFLKDDVSKLKDQLMYYIENDMEEDLQDLREASKVAGDSVLLRTNELIRQVERELEK